jgi:hypothetical protein
VCCSSVMGQSGASSGFLVHFGACGVAVNVEWINVEIGAKGNVCGKLQCFVSCSAIPFGCCRWDPQSLVCCGTPLLWMCTMCAKRSTAT